MAGAAVLELTQALSAAVPLALGGLLLAAPIVFLLKQQTKAAKLADQTAKKVGTLRHTLAVAEATDVRKSARKADTKAAAADRAARIKDLYKQLAAQTKIVRENRKIAEGFLQLKANAKSFLTFVSAPVKTPLGDALKAIGDGFTRLKGPFREFTAALGPALAPFATGVMNSLGSFLAALKPALPSIVTGFREWGRVMPQITGSVGTLLGRLAAHPEAVQGFADSFDTFLRTAGDVIVGLQGIASKYGQLEALIRGGRTGQWGDEWTKTSGVIGVAAKSIGQSQLFILRKWDDLLQKTSTDPGSPMEAWKNNVHEARLQMEADFAAITTAANKTFNKFESSGSKLAGFKAAINVLKGLKARVRAALNDPNLSKPKRIRLEIQSHHFDAQLAQKKHDLHVFQNTKSKPKLLADKSRFQKVIKQADADLKKTNNKKAKPKILADKHNAEAGLASVNRQLRALDGKSATVTVETDFKTTGTPAQAWLRKQANIHASAGDDWQGTLSGGGQSRTGGPTPINVEAPIVNTTVTLDRRVIRSEARSTVMDENRRNAYRARVGRR